MGDCPITFSANPSWSLAPEVEASYWVTAGGSCEVYLTFDGPMNVALVPDVSAFIMETDGGSVEVASCLWMAADVLRIKSVGGITPFAPTYLTYLFASKNLMGASGGRVQPFGPILVPAD